MTFEEEQDLRILTLIKDWTEYQPNAVFDEAVKDEDSSYVYSIMMHEKKYIDFGDFRVSNNKGGFEDYTQQRYRISILGRNRYDSLNALKIKEVKDETRNKMNYIFTVIAAVGAVGGIVVAIILYFLTKDPS